MPVENISQSISTKVWDQTGIKLMTPGSVIGLDTNYATGSNGIKVWELHDPIQIIVPKYVL